MNGYKSKQYLRDWLEVVTSSNNTLINFGRRVIDENPFGRCSLPRKVPWW